MSTQPVKFQDAVAAFVKEYRKHHGITQPELQRHARRQYGASWSLGSISNLEAGRLTLTLPAIAVLTASLGDLSGKTVSLDQLIKEQELIELTDELSVPGKRLQEILRGEPVKLDDLAKPGAESIAEKAVQSTRHDPPNSGSVQDAVDLNMKVRRIPVSLSLERTATKLGITPRAVQLWAFTLWGNSFDAEVTARAGEDASPQKRGHATRSLLAELEPHVKGSNG